MTIMSKEKNERSIKNAVLRQIKSGKAAMRPKWHFVLKTILVSTGILIASFALLYLVSFIYFYLRQSGILFVPSFGPHGFGVFLLSLPWLLILVSIVFFITLEVLVKRYAFTYRKPLLYSLVGIIVFVAIGSFVLAHTHLHQGLFRHAEEGRLPIVGGLYRGYGMQKMEGVHAGMVSKITTDGFIMTNRRGDELKVVITAETKFPQNMDLQEEDKVVVLGERDGDTIVAVGVRTIADEMHGFPRRESGGWLHAPKQ